MSARGSAIGTHERSLTGGSARDPFDVLDTDRHVRCAESLELPTEVPSETGVVQGRVRTREEHTDPARLLDDLPLPHGNTLHHTAKDVRVYANGTSARARHRERVLDPSFDGLERRKRESTAARLRRPGHGVAHLVADERQCPREEDADQELRAARSGRNGPVLIVHDLGDDEILEEVHSVHSALGCDPRRFRCRVHIEWRYAPRFHDSRPRLGREHFRRTHDRSWRDPKASLDLLVR
jgi:hypothetical protein